jgi:Zn-dependent protease with chaperone function
MNPRPPSLAGRAILALALMIGFYVLALGLASILLFIAYAEFAYGNRIDRLGIFGLVGGLIILWGIVPRPDAFEPPGPRLTRERHPRLFAVLEEIAASTGQAMPVDVYLVADVNAWVTTRGGFMGFGSRRVMGLGLPLLQTLDVSELRAVLAHEFGHYQGGDTRLGPWVYKTRAAIGRTLHALSLHSSMLQKPFIWYGNMFLRVSHAISRRQELSADQLAAGLYGARPLTGALGAIRRAAAAFPAYWSTEVLPVLDAGVRPPVAAGFSRFLASSRIAAAVDAHVQEPERADPYDTHPPLHERMAAVAGLPPGAASDTRRAIELVEDVDALEQEMLALMAAGTPLPAIGWDDFGQRVYVATWRRGAERHAAALAGLTVDALLDEAPRLVTRLGEEMPAEAAHPSAEAPAQYARWVLSGTLAIALVDAGWRLRAVPGEPLVLEGALGALDPFQTVEELLLGKIDQVGWRIRCETFGLRGIALARPA